MTTNRSPDTSTLHHAEAIAQLAWSRKSRKSNPWLTEDVQGFVRSMDRAGYVFEEHNYPINGYSIRNRWEQLAQWAESIAQNERDTLRGV